MQIPRSAAARAWWRGGAVTVDGAVCRKADMPWRVARPCAPMASRWTGKNMYISCCTSPRGRERQHRRPGRDRGGPFWRAYPRRQLFPAGRLDKTSTGFVLLTDDGAFAHDILSPRRHVPKTYRVRLDTPPRPKWRAPLRQGWFGRRPGHAPAGLLPDRADPFWATVELRQGYTTRSSGCSACWARG